MRIILFFAFLLNMGLLAAQDLCVYSDYRDHFFVFDHGKSIKVEDLKVEKFAVGGESILYINSQGRLYQYQNGKVHELEIGGATNIYATNHLAAYSIYEKLKVVDNGTVVTISTRTPIFQVKDSLIVFYDKNFESLRVYYNGEISDLESGLIGIPIDNLSSGANIVAYISSRTKDFKIWYQGQNNTIVKYASGLSFKAGRDIVAYFNRLDNTFHVFYKNDDIILEHFSPKSFKVGDEFVAYVDNSGGFNVFYKGEIIPVIDFAPDSYFVKDNLLVFTENNYFKVFNEGKVIELESYIPETYKIGWNTIAYLDNSNRVWAFSKGEKKYLTNDFVTSLEVFRDLIFLKAKVNRNIIYYNNEKYEGLSY